MSSTHTNRYLVPSGIGEGKLLKRNANHITLYYGDRLLNTWVLTPHPLGAFMA